MKSYPKLQKVANHCNLPLCKIINIVNHFDKKQADKIEQNDFISVVLNENEVEDSMFLDEFESTYIWDVEDCENFPEYEREYLDSVAVRFFIATMGI